MQDYGQLIRTHRESGADITICTNSVGWDMATRRGLARVNAESGPNSSLVTSLLIVFVPLRMLTLHLSDSDAQFNSVDARQAPICQGSMLIQCADPSISQPACLTLCC